MNKDALINLDSEALSKEIEATRKELFNLRLNMVAGQVKDVSQFKKLKVKIARAFTMLNEKTSKN